MKIYKHILFLLFAVFYAATAQAQQDTTATRQLNTISVFLDCQHCDKFYIRDKISFINYVRNKEDAQVHLIITRQRTGSGGTEYTLRFIGYGKFKGRDNSFTYSSPESDTRDEERDGLVRYIKLGLFPYLSRLPILYNFNIIYNPIEELQAQNQEDNWNNWVFELNGYMSLNGEESKNAMFLSGGAKARRITPAWKLDFNYDYDYNRRSFSEEDSLGNETTDTYISRNQRFNGTIVKSLNNHWSAGIFTAASSSSRNNTDLNVSGSPALEYNIYPYSEYAQHEISFMYLIRTGYYNYDERTIYNKLSEVLVKQELRIRMEFTQPWGSIQGRLNASAYMHDLSKNNVNTRVELDFRVFRGLSLTMSARYSIINDQLSIPVGDISDAEQLLNLRQQSTSYSYRTSFGIKYSFGSIFNNVVNPRF